MTGMADRQERAGKSRIAHQVLQADKFPVLRSSHPNQTGREAQNIGEFFGRGVSGESGGKFHPVKISLFAPRRGSSTKNRLPIPTVGHRLPPLGGKSSGPCGVGLSSRDTFLLALEIPGVRREQQGAPPSPGSILEPAQGETRSERIAGQPTRSICSRRPDRFLPDGKKVRTNPA